MDANMGAFGEIVLELIPQLGRLVFDVPLHVLVAWAEVALLGASGFLVAPHANNHAGKMMLFQNLLEGVFLERAATFDASGFAVGESDAALEHFLVFADEQLEFPLLYHLVA